MDEQPKFTPEQREEILRKARETIAMIDEMRVRDDWVERERELAVSNILQFRKPPEPEPPKRTYSDEKIQRLINQTAEDTRQMFEQHREWCNSLIQGQIDEHSEAVGEAIATYSQRYLETDISALQGEVAALRSDVANLQNELQRIASRLDTIEYERSASNVIDIRQPGAKPA